MQGRVERRCEEERARSTRNDPVGLCVHRKMVNDFSTGQAGARAPSSGRLKALAIPILVFFLAVFLAISPASGQIGPPATGNVTAEPAAPADPFGRGTPSGTVTGFLQAVSTGDYELAGRYLDSPGGTQRDATTARRFQAALDREGEFRPRNELSREADGSLDDALEADLEQVGTIGRGETTRPILLKRLALDDEAPIWLFSRETIQSALPLDVETQVPAEQWLPQFLSDVQVGGAPLSHWLTLAALSTIAFILSWIAIRLVLLLVELSMTRSRAPLPFLRAAVPPLTLLSAVVAGHWVAPQLGVSIVAREHFAWVILIVGSVAFSWLLWNLVDLVAHKALAGFARRGRASATAIVRMASRAAKIMIVILGLLAILDVFGFQVTAALAALGIGGIAFALGAQKTVENLIASLSIISDRPFKVGDTCRFGDLVGTVEDVGMRSTRIRSLDHTRVTIPNSLLAQSRIENLSARSQYWFHPTFHLDSASRSSAIRALMESVRSRLDGHPDLVEGRARVRLLPPDEGRLPIEIFAYVAAPDFDDFLEIQERLLLDILAQMEESGVRLCPTSLSIHSGRVQPTPPSP